MHPKQTPYPLGKLPADYLARLLTQYAPSDERVVLGPGVGRDAAVISFCDPVWGGTGHYLVAKTDPITFATDEIGWYAVHVNANDIACTGATVRWFLATLLLPEAHSDEALVDTIFGQIAGACEELGVGLVGGHTEITYGIDRPIVVGCMLGEVAPERLVRPDTTRPGDVLLVTKGIAVEGTAIIAREKADILSGDTLSADIQSGDETTGVDEALLERARGFLYDPGISVVRDAAVSTAAGKVRALHDPTEGGLATGLWELAEAAGVGLEIDESAIPILPETRALCAPLDLDPLGLIASGTLLLAVVAEDAAAILGALQEVGIAAARIGHVVEQERGLVLQSAIGERPLPWFDRDEIARLFE